MRTSRVASALVGACFVALAILIVTPGTLFSGGLATAGPRDDRAGAESALAVFETTEAGVSRLVKDPVKRSRDLLERAHRMRTAGDEVHARLAEAAALQWARVAQDMLRTADAESTAQTARVKALDASASSERERALLEQQLAQNGRLQAELRALESDAGKR